jgi:hypothetical protein
MSSIPHKSFRLAEADRALLRALALHHGISQSDVLRMCIRNEAREAGLVGRGGKLDKQLAAVK